MTRDQKILWTAIILTGLAVIAVSALTTRSQGNSELETVNSELSPASWPAVARVCEQSAVTHAAKVAARLEELRSWGCDYTEIVPLPDDTFLVFGVRVAIGELETRNSKLETPEALRR